MKRAMTRGGAPPEGGGSASLSHDGHHEHGRSRAAAVSIFSNTALIGLKVVAGLLTGSVAILTEALHSGIDLLASLIAFFSVRRAEEPADAGHRYGHDKFENAAAAAEGVLILAGSAVIAFAAIRSLISGNELDHLGVGIVVVGFAAAVNLAVSTWLFRKGREMSSPALEGDAAHLRTDAYTSIGVLVGLGLVSVTGADWLDPVVALMISVGIVVTGVRLTMGSLRVLVDEALPDDEQAAIRESIEAFAGEGVVGYHQLRTRRAGARRYVDLHVQFAHGTSLEEAHHTAHALQDAIQQRLNGADVLIHLEPADRVRPGEELRLGPRANRG
jgi:cation diffusion facilitator family transporter